MVSDIDFKANYFLRLFIISILIQFINSPNIIAQLTIPGRPYSQISGLKSLKEISSYNLKSLNIEELIKMDSIENVDNRFGVVENIELDIKLVGTKTTINGIGTIWQYTYKCPNAYSLGLFFTMFKLPEGATLFLYDSNYKHIAGAFSKLNNKDYNKLAIASFPGNMVTIEYFEPINSEFEGQLILGSISNAYRSNAYSPASIIDVNCPPGENWQVEKHAVCKMTFNSGNYSYICSGALINNTRSDGTPYFLTANHCINDYFSAISLVLYFNYESDECDSLIPLKNQNLTLSGAKLLTTSNKSDYTLLLLKEIPPKEYGPLYAGWDASGRISFNAAGIHHPNGGKKSISISEQPVTNESGSVVWSSGPSSEPNTHWNVSFDIGDVQPGSSGSPLFDDNKRIIGQCHGGVWTFWYGKLSTSWNLGLKSYLDKDNTGKNTIDSYGSAPLIDFKSDLIISCVNSSVSFFEMTKFSPTKWIWEISPSTYNFVNGTTKESQNPEIEFTKEGNYTIALTSSNTFGSNTLTKKNYISVRNYIPTTISSVYSDSIFYSQELGKIPFIGSGAKSYIFSTSTPSLINVIQNKDTAYYSYNSRTNNCNSFYSYFKVIGRQGSCITSDSIKVLINMSKVKFINYPYDSAVNGKELGYFQFSVRKMESYQFSTSARSISVHPFNNTVYYIFNPDSLNCKSFYAQFKVVGKNGSCITSDSIVRKILIPTTKFVSIPSDSILIANKLNLYAFVANGMKSYKFSTNSSSINIQQNNDTAYLKFNFDSSDCHSLYLKIRVEGTYGSCSSSDSCIKKIEMPKLRISRFSNDSIICSNDLINNTIFCLGMDSYKFSTNTPSKIEVIQNENKANLRIIKETIIPSFYTQLKVTGANGSCLSTDSLQFKIITPINDNAENAINLNPGENGPFSNECAGYEPNEPHPTIWGCTGDNSWCYDSDNYGVVVNNSLWFRYQTNSRKSISIDTKGFNTRIAVYTAESLSKLFSGNSENYNLIAANDNRDNYHKEALIKKLDVEPNTIYWIQVDGFKKAYGDLIISINSNSFEITSNNNMGHFAVVLSTDNSTKSAQFELYSAIGQLMLKKPIIEKPEITNYEFDISGFSAGIYFLVFRSGNELTSNKIVLVK